MRVAFLILATGLACGRPADAGESSGTEGAEAETSSEVSSEASSESTDTSSSETSDLPPQAQSCHPFDGPDCPEGQKCFPHDEDFDDEWDDWLCFSEGSSPLYESCSATQGWSNSNTRLDTCQAGLLCSDFYGADSLGGWCAALCDETHPCPSGSSCLPAPEGFFSWCRPTCDPNDEPSTCPTPILACSFGLEAEFVCNQRITVQGQQGDACLLPTECSYGLSCLSGAVVGPEVCGAHAACCTQMCDTAAPDCPVEAPNCTAVFPNGAEAGFETLGFCGV